MVKFDRNGKENGKTAYLVKHVLAGIGITVSTIVFDGDDWVVHHKSGRIDRFATLREAKDEAIKSAY